MDMTNTCTYLTEIHKNNAEEQIGEQVKLCAREKGQKGMCTLNIEDYGTTSY